MPETNVRCPGCDSRIKAVVSAGRTSVRCPECGSTVPLKGKAAVRDEDDEEDDRPRRRKKRHRQEEGGGPWYVAAGIAVVGFFLTFAGALVVKGTAGLAPGEVELFGLGLCFVVSVVLMVLGTIGVKNRTAYGRWGFEVTGTMGVILGMVQATMGGLLGGFSLYGVLFSIIRGH
jgi:hypothetical protein